MAPTANVDAISGLGECQSRAVVSYEFREDSGAKLSGSVMVYTLPEEFLFYRPIAYHDVHRARVTAEALALAEERLRGSDFAVEAFGVTGMSSNAA
jgi:hypothetical protein